MRGRPSKLTPILQEKIVELISLGMPKEHVCDAVGVGETTFYRWLEKGRNAKRGKYREFWEAIQKAEKDFEARALANIQRIAREVKDEEGRIVDKGNWQAWAWLLERKWPDKWGRKMKLEHSGEMKIRNITKEEEKEIKEIAKESRKKGYKNIIDNGTDYKGYSNDTYTG